MANMEEGYLYIGADEFPMGLAEAATERKWIATSAVKLTGVLSEKELDHFEGKLDAYRISLKELFEQNPEIKELADQKEIVLYKDPKEQVYLVLANNTATRVSNLEIKADHIILKSLLGSYDKEEKK